MPGPSKTPRHLKLLKGTFQPCRDAPPGPALPRIPEAPPPPGWMTNADALAEWRRLAGLLTANGLLHEGNVGVLAQLCALHGRLVKTWAGDGTPTAALLATYRSLAGSLYLLNINGGRPSLPAKANRFSNHARPRREAR